MFRPKKPTIADFRAEFAKHADFCDVFENDTQSLYLLAFLLTTNHKQSEQCFVSTVDEVFKEPVVFKEWVRSWVKRRLIENAIEIVSPTSPRNRQKRDQWSSWKREKERECEIDTVTKLAAFERFVFVMSILERYSNWECALLLECCINNVDQARMRALCRLRDFAALVSRADGIASASSGTHG